MIATRSRHHAALIAVMAILLGACRERPRGTAPSSSTASASPVSSASIAAPPASAASPPARPLDPDEVWLDSAVITSLSPVRGPMVRRGSFHVELAAAEGSRRASLWLALSADPVAHHRPLAYARLARALVTRVVPATMRRYLSAGDLAALADKDAEAMAILREARVLNDGSVEALLSARSTARAGSPWIAPEGKVLETEHARELATWERWAVAEAPVEGEDRELLRDYVEMLVLDYLAANDARRSAVLAGRALVLVDNASAFPPHPAGSILDRMLRRLRAVSRFPRGIREALAAFDEGRSAVTFAPGDFSTWILPPRTRVDLNERRAALLTLIEAKIVARGADAVLSLP